MDAVVAHAREAAPSECCGLLIGSDESIAEAIRARNLADNPNRYLVDPKDHFEAMRHARERGLAVMGFYHSHPHSSATPSRRDVDEVSYPDDLYLIVSLAAGAVDVRLFRIDDGNFLEVGFVTVP